MNWKLLIICLSFAVGISGRPANETTPVKIEVTTNAKISSAETTNLTEKSVTAEALTATTTTNPSKAIADAPTTVRYLQQHYLNEKTKPTNPRSKYANNYANLITKHTLNRQKFVNNTKGNSNITVENLSFNITSSLNGGNNKINDNSNSNKIDHIANEIASPTIPSSQVTSNSLSRPLVFVDADVTTTKRAFVALNGGINKGTWSNYNLEETGTFPTIKRKPIIHKIISKWSDNPHDVFNLHTANNQEPQPFISSQQAQITEISNQLVQNAFNNRIPTTSANVLPISIGQQMLHEEQHFKVPQTTRKPVKKVASKKPIIVSTTSVNNLLLKVQKPTKVPLKTKDNCLIKIGNKVITNYDDCKRYQIDNKVDGENFDDSVYDDIPAGFQIQTEPDFPDLPPPPGGSVPSGSPPSFPSGNPTIPSGELPSARPSSGVPEVEQEGTNDKHKKRKNKRKNQKQTQEEEENTDVGSMVMTVMTMMAVFNPLNFGVWGIVMAPMAAMLLGGACFAMYHYMNYQPKWQESHQHHHHTPWAKAQEIVIKNKIKHSPIPIKVMHLHRHAAAPQTHSMPVHEYSPPWESVKSFGEPPSDYYPSAPSGGPYTRRKSNMRKRVHRPSHNPFSFKLL